MLGPILIYSFMGLFKIVGFSSLGIIHALSTGMSSTPLASTTLYFCLSACFLVSVGSFSPCSQSHKISGALLGLV